MCGITGIFNFNNRPIVPEQLIRMNRTLVHRGPDEEGYYLNAGKPGSLEAGKRVQSAGGKEDGVWRFGNGKGNVGLGHRRLSIIDLATGQQPLCNENGSIWVVFNGEIYNFHELKAELEDKGHIFRTVSDTETIVHAYEEWGINAVQRFRGMFAIALWDENRQELVLLRDRVGKKPVYYYLNDQKLVFASEIKAILEIPGIEKDIDLLALSDYLSLAYIPSPKTIFKHIHKMPAAHYASIKNKNMRIAPYWDISFYPSYGLSDEQMIDDLLGILEEASKIRMISEVPLGAFLSGGVDSSAVVAMMAKDNQQSILTNSISFTETKYNEAPFARMVADLFGTCHNEHLVTPEAIPIVEKLSWHYDEPFADSSAVPTYYVSKTARKNVTVSLSGDGGDENFAGYSRYYFDQRENRIRNIIPRPFQGPFFGFIQSLYPRSNRFFSIFRGRAFINNVARDPVDAYFFTVSAIHESEKERILNNDVLHAAKDYSTLDLFKKYYHEAQAEDHLSRIQYLDIKTYLCDDILTKVDRASMAVSLEVRSPLLDHVLMEYVARIPQNRKLVHNNGKYIFKKALERHLPREILYRNKMGFALPVAEWLRKEIKEYGEKKVINGDATRNYLNKKYVQKIWDEHQSKAFDWSPKLWMMLMLNLWHDRFLA